MSERQLDFFSDMGVEAEQGLSRSMGHALVPAGLPVRLRADRIDAVRIRLIDPAAAAPGSRRRVLMLSPA
jgi:hypothetical protein